MKKFIIPVCILVVVSGLFFITSALSRSGERHNKFVALFSLQQKYDNLCHQYDCGDDASYDSAMDLRQQFLERYARLSDDEQAEYEKFQSKMVKADKDYLGSVYYEDTDSDSIEIRRLESYSRLNVQ